MQPGGPLTAGGAAGRVLLVTTEPLGERLAGPAIRAVEAGRLLGREGHEVVIATLAACALDDEPPRLRFVGAGRPELERLAHAADVVVLQGDVLTPHPWLARSPRPMIVDLYDPFHLEQLEQSRGLAPGTRRARVMHAVATLNRQLARGDFFLCASDRQRDLWLGHLAALGRVNPATYDGDPMLKRLIAVAPFGVPAQPPVRRGPGTKGIVPGIAAEDRLVLWGGGIWNWLDPLTVIKAVDLLRTRQPRVRLLFLGGGHPNPTVPAMRMAADARALADARGLTGSHVFFNEGWVPYDERHDHLLDADVAVSAHVDHVETAFSYRTRVLDYVWARVPVVTTAGDAVASLVTAAGAGLGVPSGDVLAMADALATVLGDETVASTCRAAADRLAPTLAWEHALAPLVTFCAEPRRAPDLLDAGTRATVRRYLGPPAVPLSGLRGDLAALQQQASDGGLRAVASAAVRRLARVAGARRRT